MKVKNANLFLGLLATLLLVAALGFSACSTKGSEEPTEVVKNFILYCEAGEMQKAEGLLASKNNVDYFKKYKKMGKDMLFIDYTYEKNDDVLEITFTRKNQNEEIAIVQVDTNYKIQQHKFSKDVILHKENGAWKIYEYPSMYPVKVR